MRRSQGPEGPLPLDLHVLGLPLAFILSQDQTLHSIILNGSLFIQEIAYLLNIFLKGKFPLYTSLSSLNYFSPIVSMNFLCLLLLYPFFPLR